MKHHVTVGKPIKKGDKVTGYEDVREVPTNESFRYNKLGFVTIPPDPIKRPAAEEKKQGKKKTAKKSAPKKSAPKKSAPKKSAPKKSAGK